MRVFLFVMLVAVMGSTALVIRSSSKLRRQSRQAPTSESPISTTTESECICVLFNKCHSNYTRNKFGVTLIDLRGISPCAHYLDVCCKPEHLLKPDEISSQQSNSSSSGSSDNPLPESSITDSPSTTDNPSSSLPLSSSPLPESLPDSPASSSSPDDSASATDAPFRAPLPSNPESTSEGSAPSSSSEDRPAPSPSPADFSSPCSPMPSSPLPDASTEGPILSSSNQSPDVASSGSAPGSPSEAQSSNPLPGSDIVVHGLPADSMSPALSVIDGPSGSSHQSHTPNHSGTDIREESGNEDPNTIKKIPRPVVNEHYKSPGCGVRNVDGVGFRITGAKDHETQFGEFPWVVALLREEETFICGGSLIHPSVVLTAAHCVRGVPLEHLVARAGEWDRATTHELLPHQDREVMEVIEHEEHFHEAVLNDVALLILKEPFKLTSTVDTICLPSQNQSFDFSHCVASGWGKDNFNSQKNQVILRKVNLPIVPSDSCQEILRSTRLGNLFELHNSFICAGGKKGEDTCTGDGGSPLMCPLKNSPERYEQAGIVAWGIGCGESIPGVYASVSLFRNWIDAKLSQKGIKISSSFLDVRSS